MTERWTMQDMLILAARGLGRVDRDGMRGVTGVTMEEIEAMAGALAVFGLVPIPPGGAVPDRLIVQSEKDT